MAVVKFATQIDQDILKELRLFSKESDRSISKVVNEALSDYLKRVRIRSHFTSAMEEVISENSDLLSRLAK